MDSKKQKQKRARENDTDSDNENDSWPHYLIMEGTDPEKPLQKLSPFAINKGIVAIASPLTVVKKLRSGQFLIQTYKKAHCDNLLKMTSIAYTPVKVSPHRTLNSVKGVIRCPDIKECSDDDILEGLKSQRVTEIYRIMINRDGVKKPTGTIILTFNSRQLPTHIRVGYLSVKVDAYIPNPVRCFKCQRFGHFKTACKHPEACGKCGQTDHNSDELCFNDPKCVNCGGNHHVRSKDCPKWIEEKSIQRIKHEKGISYLDAKKQLNLHQTGLNYSQAVKSKQTATAEVQTLLTWVNNKAPSIYDFDAKQTVQPVTAGVQTDPSTINPPNHSHIQKPIIRPKPQPRLVSMNVQQAEKALAAENINNKKKEKKKSGRSTKAEKDPVFTSQNSFDPLSGAEDMDQLPPPPMSPQKAGTSRSPSSPAKPPT